MLKLFFNFLLFSFYSPIIYNICNNLYYYKSNIKNNVKTYIHEKITKCKCSVCVQKRIKGYKSIH